MMIFQMVFLLYSATKLADNMRLCISADGELGDDFIHLFEKTEQKLQGLFPDDTIRGKSDKNCRGERTAKRKLEKKLVPYCDVCNFAQLPFMF